VRPEERVLRARLAAHESWANTTDPTARTEPARTAFQNRFLEQVDPEGRLSSEERERRAESARKAYYTRLSFEAAVARRKARQFTEQADEADARLADIGGAPT
jgi:hypothetical protein